MEAAGDVAMKDIDSNPLTKEQFQLLESIVFPTRPKPKEKRKPVDFSEYSEKKWEERLYVVCIPLNNFAPCDGINLIFTLGSHTQNISRNHLTAKSLSDCKWGTELFYSLCMTFSLRFRPLHPCTVFITPHPLHTRMQQGRARTLRFGYPEML